MCSALTTNAAANIVESADYMPYGGKRNSAATIGSANYHFTDQEREPETGLYNYDARLYDPVIGRFVSADPLVPGGGYDPQMLDRYAYVRNSPLIYVDPTGYYIDTTGKSDEKSKYEDDCDNAKWNVDHSNNPYSKVLIETIKGRSEGEYMEVWYTKQGFENYVYARRWDCNGICGRIKKENWDEDNPKPQRIDVEAFKPVRVQYVNPFRQELGNAVIETGIVVGGTLVFVGVKAYLIGDFALGGPLKTAAMIGAGTPQGQELLKGAGDALSAELPTTPLGSVTRLVHETYNALKYEF